MRVRSLSGVLGDGGFRLGGLGLGLCRGAGGMIPLRGMGCVVGGGVLIPIRRRIRRLWLWMGWRRMR